MFRIHSNIPQALPTQQPEDVESKVEKLFEAMAEVRKELRELYKQLDAATSIAERMAIRHRIESLEEMLETLRQQLLVLTQLQHGAHQRKVQYDIHAPGPANAASAPQTDGQEREDPGTYEPPGAAPAKDE